MSVREFTDLALSKHSDEIKIYDNEISAYIYEGVICDLQDDILDRDIGSWNIEDNTICLNID